MGKFEVKTGESGKFHFNLKAGNGQVILTSGTYATQDEAASAIAEVQKRASDDASFERKTSVKDEPYFVMVDGDGKMLGRSEMYTSTSGMENGVASVQKNAPDADTVTV